MLYGVSQESTTHSDAGESGDRRTLMTIETVLTFMPIDIETFSEANSTELSEVTNAEKVVRFLLHNDDKAFTPSEIAEGTGVKKNSISTVLRRLENRELVQHKGDYWAIGDRDRVQDAFQFKRVINDLDERYGEEDANEWREHAADARE